MDWEIATEGVQADIGSGERDESSPESSWNTDANNVVHLLTDRAIYSTREQLAVATQKGKDRRWEEDGGHGHSRAADCVFVEVPLDGDIRGGTGCGSGRLKSHNLSLNRCGVAVTRCAASGQRIEARLIKAEVGSSQAEGNGEAGHKTGG